MMKKFYCSVSAILGGICLIFSLLPISAFAQSKPSEIYWLYYTPDSSAYVERVYEWGGYKDCYHYSDHTVMRANAEEKYRADYDRRCMERAKTLVFYTKKDLERDPVRLKPGDTFNQARRKKD